MAFFILVFLRSVAIFIGSLGNKELTDIVCVVLLAHVIVHNVPSRNFACAIGQVIQFLGMPRAGYGSIRRLPCSARGSLFKNTVKRGRFKYRFAVWVLIGRCSLVLVKYILLAGAVFIQAGSSCCGRI